jgi:uncharacterized protein YcaQ
LVQPEAYLRREASVSTLTISKITRRRFILGKQGLYPGRRWQGKAGVAAALRAGAVVQVDPLNVVARSHDIVLYGRVLDYRPALLQTLLYEDHTFFEYGGTVMLHPMDELPYWRVVMARKQQEARRVQFAQEYADVIEMVHNAIQTQGPLSATNFQDSPVLKGTFRSGKVANQALYYLWIAGEILTHSRRGLERVYDLRERMLPAHRDDAATAEEADAFFALKALQKGGILTAREWRNWFAGIIQRPVEGAEASARLDALLLAGKIASVVLQEDASIPHFVLAEDLPLLEKLHAGQLPEEWQPLDTSTDDEMTLLAPLEIVSTRGRALSLFDFDYLWEVYKPQEKRRWGYYTLPILYQDRLVARTDLKLERKTNTLALKGFWLENHAVIDDQFLTALASAFKRFMHFIDAEALDGAVLGSTEIRDEIQKRLDSFDTL